MIQNGSKMDFEIRFGDERTDSDQLYDIVESSEFLFFVYV